MSNPMLMVIIRNGLKAPRITVKNLVTALPTEYKTEDQLKNKIKSANMTRFK